MELQLEGVGSGEQVSSQPSMFTPITLPCGRVMENRLVKVAMYEHLATLYGGPPNSYHWSLYARWSRAGWGMVVTGNVQILSNHLSLGRDIIIPPTISKATLEPFQQLSAAMHSSAQSLAIMQLSHAGRQSPNFLGGRRPFKPPQAPSPVRVGSSTSSGFLADAFHRVCFQTPKAMTSEEIDQVVECFARGAQVAIRSGFDGIQLHAAHGYLLAQFLSPKTNLRHDEYSHPNGFRVVNRILERIRAEAPPQFIIGIKLNASDYASSASEAHALLHISELATCRYVDFIEISGGDYENPEFMSTKASASPRQALFSVFSQEAVRVVETSVAASPRPPPLVILTGGFQTSQQLYTALRSRHAHLLGIGRCSLLCPNLPHALLQQERRGLAPSTVPFSPRPYVESDSPTALHPRWACLWEQIAKIKLVGAGTGIAWYTLAIRSMAAPRNPADKEGKRPDLDMGVLRAICSMWLWIGPGKYGPFGGFTNSYLGVLSLIVVLVAVTMTIV